MTTTRPVPALVARARPTLLLALAAASSALGAKEGPGSDAAGPAVPAGTVVSGPIGARMDAWFSRLVPFGYSGGVVAWRDGEVLLLKGYGMADRAGGVPFTPDTRFPIGSNTKPITSIAIQRLQAMGKLTTDDLVSDHVDGVPADREAWTLHELLTHTAGLPGGSGFDYVPFSRDDLIRFALSTDLRSRPGREYAYSNVGFSLLAAILELRSGETYEEFTQEHVLRPAGMTRTGYRLDAVLREEYAHGYLGEEDWGTVLDRHWTEDGPSWHLMGNGGTQSTLRDMLRFHLALRDDTIVSSEAKQEMWTPYVDEGGGASFYGYGWTIRETDRGTKDVWHSGGNPYFRNEMHRYVEEDAYLYLHTNDGAWPAGPLLAPAEEMLFGGAPPLPPALAPLDAAALDAFAGMYALDGGASFDVERVGATLRIEADGERAFGALHGAGGAAGDELARRRARSEASEERVREALFGEDDGGFLATHLRRLAEEEGPFDGVRALGTVPPAEPLDGVPEDAEMAVVALRRPGGELSVMLLWSGEHVVGLDLPESFDAAPVVHPTGGDRFTTFAPGLDHRLEVAFERDADGRVVALVVEGAAQVRAVRDE